MADFPESFNAVFPGETGYDLYTGPPGWEHVFEESRPDLIHITRTLDAMTTRWLPAKRDLFRALELTPLPQVRVVILGQDPYPRPEQAMGLAFSVPVGVKIPSSLSNIFRELVKTVPGFRYPSNGNLTPWAEQGVLLLNTCLTVQEGIPESHKKLWSGFVTKIIDAIAAVRPECIFILWGKKAQTLKRRIGNKSIILEGAHPSGLSADRGFFGGDYFNKANQALIEMGETPINWQI